VTLTHTGGVLVLGLLLTAGTQLAGERIVSWLGLISGTVVLAVGATMLTRIVRHHFARRAANGPADHRPHDHGHGHAHGGHEQEHGHDGSGGHGHGRRRGGRWGLAGIGIAGGLVPSPSALVVLLAAIGLGRTGFGILLVVAYGAGMAATLTGAGLLLVAVQRHLSTRAAARPTDPHSDPSHRRHRLALLPARLSALTPTATAALILLLGIALAIRSATAVV
jgi:ABC-type nickel/cobalt efflux system permease component RcnA